MDKVKEFLIKVKELNKKYDLDLFCVTEGNSIYNMKHETEAVKLAEVIILNGNWKMDLTQRMNGVVINEQME